MAELAEAEANDTVARKIYALRKRADLTQQQLAKLVGTTTSVICRLEDADYQGHSLAMLKRVANALNKRVELRFVNAHRNPKVGVGFWSAKSASNAFEPRRRRREFRISASPPGAGGRRAKETGVTSRRLRGH